MTYKDRHGRYSSQVNILNIEYHFKEHNNSTQHIWLGRKGNESFGNEKDIFLCVCSDVHHGASYGSRMPWGEETFEKFVHEWYKNNMYLNVTTLMFLDKLYNVDDSETVKNVVEQYMKFD